MADWNQELRARLAPLRLAPAREVEIVEELSQHLDDQRRDLIASGVDPDTATQQILDGLLRGDALVTAIAPLRLSRNTAPRDLPVSDHRFAGWRADLRDACGRSVGRRFRPPR